MVAFGVILLILALALFIVPAVNPKVREKLPGGFRKIISLLLITVALILMFFNALFFYAEPGMSYLVQYISGTQKSILTAGFHLKLFGQVLSFKKYLTVRFALDEGDQVFSGYDQPIEIRFNDAVSANVELSVRFQLPEDDVNFKSMALAFRSQKNLINSCLKPVIKEVVRNSGRILSAQEYIIGKGGEFEFAVLDQLENGIYILETIETKTSELPEDITRPEEDRQIERRETIKYDVIKKLDEEGNIVRKKHTLNAYLIKIAQATIENVDPETKFKEMLAQQRDAAARANVERQKTKEAEYRKQRIIAEGEAEKSQKRIDKEKEQIEIIISMETEKKKEEIRVEQKKLEFKSAELEAKAQKVKADAAAYERERLMRADNALEMRLNAYKEVSRYYAEALKDKQLVPEIVISNDGKGGNTTATDLINLLMAKTARDLSMNISPAQK